MLGVKGGEGRVLSKQPASSNEVCVYFYIDRVQRGYLQEQVVTGQEGVASHCQRVGLDWIVEKVKIFFMLPCL